MRSKHPSTQMRTGFLLSAETDMVEYKLSRVLVGWSVMRGVKKQKK